MSIVLSFDIGIRNLAWCLMRKTGTQVELLGWENYDLLAGQSAEKTTPTNKETCVACSAKAAYKTKGGGYCVRHCPSDKPPLRDVSGALLRGLPNAGILKQILQAKGVTSLPKSKGDLTKELEKHFALPVAKEKKKKAINTELTVIHDSIRRFILSHIELFRQATDICLENQPVLKNPTMKSVQMLLFATLRDCLQPGPPTVRLVHAKKKVEGGKKGDEGYKERKLGSEERAKGYLKPEKVKDVEKWQTVLAKYSKKNDLTDAFCMCLDFLAV